MNTFKFVIVSKDEKCKFDQSSFSNFENCSCEFILNNKDPLPVVYNRFIESNTDDFIIFMHADVFFDIKHLTSRIEECKHKYDVIGLCGASRITVSKSPLNWWTGSNPTPKEKWGFVKHGEFKNQVSWFNSDRPNVEDHEVSCIDGLCIILSKNAIEKGLRFDPVFAFDFYDTDLSFSAMITHKLKLGVIIEKSLYHYSVGQGILNENFLRTEILFRKKWNIPIPENSPINKFKND